MLSNAKSVNFSARKAHRSGLPDIPLAVVTLGLLAFGVLMVYSASMYNGEVNYGDRYFFMYKQIFGVLAGIAAMVAMSVIDYRRLMRARFVIVGVGIALLGIVLIPGVGVENYGARRWIDLGFITLQASEVAKVGYVLFAAGYMAKNAKNDDVRGAVAPARRRCGHLCAYNARTQYVRHDVRRADHADAARDGRYASAPPDAAVASHGGARRAAHLSGAVPTRAPDGVRRPVGVAARRGIPVVAILLRAGERRTVRCRAVQFQTEIPVPALCRERFHLRS